MAQVIVTASYLQQDGVTPATGRVEFRRNSVLVDAAADTISAPVLTIGTLVDGALSETLLANDGAEPTGTSYEVRERIHGAEDRTWTLVLDATSPIDLADKAPALVEDPAFNYVTSAELAAALDAFDPGEATHPDLAAHDLLGLATQAELGIETQARSDADDALAADLTTETLARATADANHAADTTDIHGIADTAALVVTTDPRLSDDRDPNAHTHVEADITDLGSYPDATGQAATQVAQTDGAGGWTFIATPSGEGGGTDDQTAAEVPFTPAGGLGATDVQAALVELDTEKASDADLTAEETARAAGDTALDNAKQDVAEKGQANGYASLGADGLVPDTQLPAPTGTSVAVQDEGTEVVAAASTLNFVGAGATASDAGDGTVTVTIPGGDGTTPYIVATDATYGAAGDGTTNDTAALQAALDAANTAGGGEVYVPGGTYLTTAALQIGSNTRLVLAKDATIKRGGSFDNMLRNRADGTTGGYDAAENIEVVGGTWDTNGTGFASNVTTIAFGHATNIAIRDTVINDVHGFHHIELAAVQHGRVEGCTFGAMNSGASGTEAIQLDLFKTSGGFPWFGPYDNTPCDNIVIDRNVFDGANIPSGVGSHTSTNGVSHANVSITNNRFDGNTQYAIQAESYAKLSVRGNRIDCAGGINIIDAATGTRDTFLVSGNRVVASSLAALNVAAASGDITDVIVAGNHLSSLTLGDVTRVAVGGNVIDVAVTTTGSTVGYEESANYINGSWTGGEGGGHTHTALAYEADPTVTNLRDALVTLGLMEEAPVAATVPDAPIIGTATAGDGQATVPFTAPVDDGGEAITGYTATSSPGGLTATGASSPLTVTGLTNDTAYTFTVVATNSVGDSAPSAASNEVTPVAAGAATVTPTGEASDSTVNIGGTDYRVIVFNGNGSLEVAGASVMADHLVVGGGGSGGSAGGGGGAGEVALTTGATLTADTYPIVIGAGGASQPTRDSSGFSGESSSFAGVTAIGGGLGGGFPSVGGPGGSGGGGGGRVGRVGGTGTAGFNGGAAKPNNTGATSAGGGGGGASAVGADGVDTGSRAGDGGAGVDHSATFGTGFGVSGVVGGGGGGQGTGTGADGTGTGGTNGGGTGGVGGGGDGGTGNEAVVAATANTGGGGGGAGFGSGAVPSGAGGSGVVVVRIPA